METALSFCVKYGMLDLLPYFIVNGEYSPGLLSRHVSAFHLYIH